MFCGTFPILFREVRGDRFFERLLRFAVLTLIEREVG